MEVMGHEIFESPYSKEELIRKGAPPKLYISNIM
jgi:hypothetical protein